MGEIYCSNCGEILNPESEFCPKCGSRNRTIILTEHVRALEMIQVKQKADGYKRFKKKIKKGEKISKSGRIAREVLIIDKEKRRKYHRVEELNEDGSGLSFMSMMSHCKRLY